MHIADSDATHAQWEITQPREGEPFVSLGRIKVSWLSVMTLVRYCKRAFISEHLLSLMFYTRSLQNENVNNMNKKHFAKQ